VPYQHGEGYPSLWPQPRLPQSPVKAIVLSCGHALGFRVLPCRTDFVWCSRCAAYQVAVGGVQPQRQADQPGDSQEDRDPPEAEDSQPGPPAETMHQTA
jgi:hypothetical protein